MSQRYADPVQLERMKFGLCPECGGSPSAHSNDVRFWMPRSCDLTEIGVRDRIAQYEQDASA